MENVLKDRSGSRDDCKEPFISVQMSEDIDLDQGGRGYLGDTNEEFCVDIVKSEILIRYSSEIVK